MTINYKRPFLYDKQEAALFCPERYSMIEASTKSGKTVGCMAWILEQAILAPAGKNRNFWWVSPGYNQSDIAFRRIKQGIPTGAFTSVESPTPKLILPNTSVIWFKSGDNSDSLYGEDVFAAVIDEASRVKEDSFYAVRSTLTATNGPMRIIGNVKGKKNWFYRMCRAAEAEMLEQPTPELRRMRYAKITALDAIAAGVTAAEELEDARATLPDSIFRELYYAEPADDEGNPFGPEHIRNCTRPAGWMGAEPAVAFGIDLAKKRDWFVVIGLNAYGEVCTFERWQGVPWAESIRRVHKLVGEDIKALVDSTGLGDPVLEQLQVEHGNFHGYTFTASSKQKLMEGLAVALQSGELAYPEGQIPFELNNFEYVYTASGVKYAGIEGEGLHDDCVAALALARQCWREAAPGDNMIKYYAENAKRARGQEAREEKLEQGLPYKRDQAQAGLDLATALDNELKELYEAAVQTTLAPSDRLCSGCGQPMTGSARVTDGEFNWHPACAGRRNAA